MFRVRALAPFRKRKRYCAGATSSIGQTVPLTTIVLKKASVFQIGGIIEPSVSVSGSAGGWAAAGGARGKGSPYCPWSTPISLSKLSEPGTTMLQSVPSTHESFNASISSIANWLSPSSEPGWFKVSKKARFPG